MDGDDRAHLLRSAAPGPSSRRRQNSAGTTDLARRELINCYNASAFALPDQYTFGNASRNLLRGPRFSQTDPSLMKMVPFGGGIQLGAKLMFSGA